MSTNHKLSIERAAKAAGVAHETWMQDWPIEVSDDARADEFLKVLEAESDPDIAIWLIDLVLESVRGRPDIDTFEPRLMGALERWARADTRIRERLEYWACEGSPTDESFEVSPIVRRVLAAEADSFETEPFVISNRQAAKSAKGELRI